MGSPYITRLTIGHFIHRWPREHKGHALCDGDAKRRTPVCIFVTERGRNAKARVAMVKIQDSHSSRFASLERVSDDATPCGGTMETMEGVSDARFRTVAVRLRSTSHSHSGEYNSVAHGQQRGEASMRMAVRRSARAPSQSIADGHLSHRVGRSATLGVARTDV